MPVPTKIKTFADGVAVSAEDLNKTLYQQGRLHNFDSANGGGAEIINGQVTLANFGGAVVLDPRHVRRGAFVEGPWIAGFRQGRDIALHHFPDTDAVFKEPDYLARCQPVLGRTFTTNGVPDTFVIKACLHYTIGSVGVDSDYEESGSNPSRHIPDDFAGNTLLKTGIFLFFDGKPLGGFTTPLSSGRSSTMPSTKDDPRYYNSAIIPDWRAYTVECYLDVQAATDYGLIGGFDDSPFAPGWHTVSIRVTTRRNMRLHGGYVTVKPFRGAV